MRRISRTAVFALVLGVSSATWGASTSVVRTFHLTHRPVTEVSQVVQGLLSPQGSLTVHPRSGILTVQDTPATVRMITEVLKEIDVTPPVYRVEVRLLEATDHPAKNHAGAPGIDPRIARMFHFKSYRLLARTVIEWDRPGPVEADLGGGYELRARALARRFGNDPPVTLQVKPAGGKANVKVMTPIPALGANDVLMAWKLGGRNLLRALLRIHRVVLENLSLTSRKGRNGRALEVLRSNVILSPSQRIVLAASPDEHSQKALILLLKALPVRQGTRD